jgi:hypothetical protein
MLGKSMNRVIAIVFIFISPLVAFATQPTFKEAKDAIQAGDVAAVMKMLVSGITKGVRAEWH